MVNKIITNHKLSDEYYKVMNIRYEWMQTRQENILN